MNLVLKIDDFTPINIKKNSRESDILNALLLINGIKRKTSISYDEILEKLDADLAYAKKLSNALYQASRRINTKITLASNISQFLIYDTHEVSLNLNCF